MQNATHLSDEWPFVNYIARSLPPEERARWEACRSGHTFQAFHSKEVVAYKLVDDVPKILKVLVCEEMNIDLRKGTSTIWSNTETGESFYIGHMPVEVAPSCFMWHLRHTTIDLYEYRGHHSVKFNIAYRTLLNPKVKESDKVYLLESAAFRNNYPAA